MTYRHILSISTEHTLKMLNLSDVKEFSHTSQVSEGKENKRKFEGFGSRFSPASTSLVGFGFDLRGLNCSFIYFK